MVGNGSPPPHPIPGRSRCAPQRSCVTQQGRSLLSTAVHQQPEDQLSSRALTVHSQPASNQTMDFSLTPDQQNIRDAILKHCSRFPDEYWLERDREGVFPRDFFESMVEAGWLGI